MMFPRDAQYSFTHRPLRYTVLPGTEYQRTYGRMPRYPEHAAVIAHQRAYTADGWYAVAFDGRGATVDSQAMMAAARQQRPIVIRWMRLGIFMRGPRRTYAAVATTATL